MENELQRSKIGGQEANEALIQESREWRLDLGRGPGNGGKARDTGCDVGEFDRTW